MWTIHSICSYNRQSAHPYIYPATFMPYTNTTLFLAWLWHSYFLLVYLQMKFTQLFFFKLQFSVCAGLVGHNCPYPAPDGNWFLALDQQRVGACPALVFHSQVLVLRLLKSKGLVLSQTLAPNQPWIQLMEKGYMTSLGYHLIV